MLAPDESAIFPDSVAATACACAAGGTAAKAIVAKPNRAHRKYRDFANFTPHPHEIGLFTRSDEKLTDDWISLHQAISTWIRSEDLQQVILEVYNPTSDALITRWDIDVVYAWDGSAGRFWTDTEQLRYAIRKQGVWPADARYRVLLQAKPGRPDVSRTR